MQLTMFTRSLLIAIGSCVLLQTPSPAPATFAADLAFLQAHTKVVVLGQPGGAQVVVAPEYQGRVMTSTTGAPDAPGFGWIGRVAIAARARQPHMNVFGGEDRFWLGPEGGQYALFFKPGDPFDLDHWQTPAPIDWGPWPVTSQSAAAVAFATPMTLVNHAGATFSLRVTRTIRLLGADAVTRELHATMPPAGVRMVAFESSNDVANAGSTAWTPDKGLVSIWILGQFTPTPATTIAIPFVPGPETARGPIVNDAYFGKVPADRLQIKDGVIRFRGDGQYRSKIGLSPGRAMTMAASYDRDAHVLTIVQFTKPENARDYVNSMWEVQKEPYRGDALNSYNDGPLGPGKPGLGPFYELESSSPALKLTPGARYTHVHRTFHFQGNEAALDPIARGVLHVGLGELAGTFPH